MDCHNCTHRREVPGNCHIRCAHPSIGQADPLLELMSMLSSRGGPAIDIASAVVLGITLNAHGVKHGWANWPFCFDPIWVDTCRGFQKE